MPSYDFKCGQCEHYFTVTKSMSDDSIPPCPKCSSPEKVNRVWKPVNLGGVSTPSSSSSCTSCSGGSCSSCK